VRYSRALAACLALALACGLSLSPAWAVAGLSSGTAATQTAAPGWQVRMLEKVNTVRAAAGVAPVRLCPRLQRSATAYAQEMAATNHFGHTDVNGTGLMARVNAHGYRSRTLGENLGAGQLSVVQVMRAWRASAPHNATLTYPGFHHVGFGYAPGGSAKYGTYWVQQFGSGGRC
jgi:uncharacterized protein YkwD